MDLVSGSRKDLVLTQSVAKRVKLGEKPLGENDAVKPQKIGPLGSGSAKVNEGKW